MKPIARLLCLLLQHNWRLDRSGDSDQLVCARCGAQQTVKRVRSWYHKDRTVA